MIEWKEVEGWNGKYKVSTDGRVWNTIIDVETAQVLTGIPQYKYVNLRLDGTHKLVRVHRLVAEAFIENPDNLPMVDHMDRDKMNNHVSNLRWVDSSGNQRNTDSSWFIGELHLKDFVLPYENPNAAYAHIISSLNAGLTQQEAVDKYHNFLEYGKRQTQVEWNEDTVYLIDLCKNLGKDYDSVRTRLSQGWDIWNAVYDINPECNRHSFEVAGKNNVGHWFPSRNYFSGMHSESFLKYIEAGLLYEDALVKDGKDHHRQTVLGVYGTIKELCEHFGISESAVTTMMTKKGKSLEEALTTPRQRVKRLSINGVYNSPKYWYESFGIDPKAANGYKSKYGKTFKETFEHYGVDVSEMVISIV